MLNETIFDLAFHFMRAQLLFLSRPFAVEHDERPLCLPNVGAQKLMRFNKSSRIVALMTNDVSLLFIEFEGANVQWLKSFFNQGSHSKFGVFIGNQYDQFKHEFSSKDARCEQRSQ